MSLSVRLRVMQNNENIKIDAEKNLFHAYLFVCQKRESAQKNINQLIKDLCCLKEDINIIEPSEESGKAGEIPVETIRSFIHQLSLTSHGEKRIGIIYDVDRLNVSSSNILLKTLEEPPKNAIVILTARNNNITPTIQSRCRVIRINDQAESESITYSYCDFIDAPLHQSFKKIEEIVKDNRIEKLLADWMQEFEVILLVKYDIKIALILEKIIKARKKIAGNANARLVLENLILFMKQNYVR